jgi:hypothetical protein
MKSTSRFPESTRVFKTHGVVLCGFVRPIKDPARFDWHEVTKVAHDYLSVDALTQPDLPAGRQVQVREDSPPYGATED